MSETLTSLTDLLLFLSSVVFAIALVRLRHRGERAGRIAWIALFVALAVASGAGATYHATIASVSPGVSGVIWIVTMLAVGASLSLLEASIFITAAVPRMLLSIPVIQLAAFIVVMSRTVDYRFVAFASAATLVICTLAIILTPLRRDSQGMILIAAFALSIVAAAAQQSQLRVGALDRNGIYHLLQLAANALIFVAARASLLRGRDVTVREARA